VDLETVKQREKAHHERERTSDVPLPPVDLASVERDWLAPTWTTGKDRYNDVRNAFHRRIEAAGGVAGKRVLDYACGNGLWAMVFGLRGARHVVGFDLAEVGVKRAMRRAQVQGVADRVQFLCGDAMHLPFADGSFDLVIGHGVIHHVIKYPGIFPELHRVLKVGGRALFHENLADNPLARLWWWWKGEVPEGDVPLFDREIRRQTTMFRHVEIQGLELVHSTAHFVFRHPTSAWRRRWLRATHSADEAIFRLLPAARRWGSFSILVLER
jgi:SAM-dependent methyltransferase